MKRVEDSKNVPQVGKDTPFAEWKRIDVMQEALAGRDQGRAEQAGGTLTMDEWVENLMKGEGA